MRPVRIITTLAFAAAVAVTGCSARTTVAHPSAAAVPVAATPVATTPPPAPTPASPRPAPKPTPTTPAAPRTPTAPPRPYFTTPQAAMRYLTVAYNHNDLVALGHVTTPVARANLLVMRRTAINLRLVGCTANAGRGDYLCSFTHDYPASLHVVGHGHAHFTAAPADKYGWYMTVLEDCS
jgi:hypothetical protein